MGKAHLSVGENVEAVSPHRPGFLCPGGQVVLAAICEKDHCDIFLLLLHCFCLSSSISLRGREA